MGIEAWSTTAASNNASPPDGAPEGQTPGSVNNVIRQCMASVREYEAAEWVDFGHVITRTDNDTFSVPGDLTALYQVGRRLKVDGSATGYCTISAATFSTPNTIVDVTMDSGNLPVTLSTVYVGMLSVSNHSLPSPLPAISGANLTALNASNISSGSLADGRLSSNVPLKNAANVFTASQRINVPTGESGLRLQAAGVGDTAQIRFNDGTLDGYIGAAPFTAGFNLGTASATVVGFYTNATQRGAISAAGNWTINAPDSGIAFAATGAAGAAVMQLTAPAGTDATLVLAETGGASWSTVVDQSTGQLGWYDGAAYRARLSVSGGLILGAPTGGDKGAGTLNTAGAIYQNNVAVALSDALNASALTSGTVPDARFPATLPAASGANLTALNATQLTSGTVPDARFPATLPAASGANLTALNATNIASGTLANARLPATINVATDLQINSVSIFASGTFTATLTGCTTSPTGTATWYRAGNIVTLVLPVLTGVSNSTSMTITGLPAGIQPATLPDQSSRLAIAVDNGANVDALARIQDGSGTITIFKTSLANFTSSGTKGLSVESVITYLLT
jgi:hypothetical protein